MKLAIMQPYFMPYVGYFQLIKASDMFVAYDDVTYIKQGWINRNNLLMNGVAHKFTIPLSNGSSNVLIKDVLISAKSFDQWKKNFYKTLMSSYRKAPEYNHVMELMDQILSKVPVYIADLAIQSIQETLTYLGIPKSIYKSSEICNNTDLSSQQRVLDICQQVGADVYINPLGGQELYSKDVFKEYNLELFFIKPNNIVYPQFKNEFVPWLSMIDLLMFNSPEEIQGMLDCYELI